MEVLPRRRCEVMIDGWPEAEQESVPLRLLGDEPLILLATERVARPGWA